MSLHTSADVVMAYLSAHSSDDSYSVPQVFELGLHDVLGIYGQIPVEQYPSARVTTLHLHGFNAFVLAGKDSRRPPCALCFHRRWQVIRHKEERDALELHGKSCAVPSSPWLTPLVLEALRAVAYDHINRSDPNPDHTSAVRRIRLDNLAMSTVPLVADPDCPLCGVKPEVDLSRLTLPMESRMKISPDVYRTKSLSDYQIDFDALANPVCGLLGTSAHAAFDSTTTMPVTGYSYVRGLRFLYEFFWSGHSNSIRDSRILAVLEGLERYAGLLSRGLPDPIWATFDELQAVGHHVMDPRVCTLYPDTFYDFSAPYFTKFASSLSIPWVWGRNLVRNRPELVAQRLVHYLDQAGPAFVDECSNGCATGGSPEEAVFHGLLELIERDSFLVTWFAKFRATEIDPRSSGAEDIDMMVARMRLEGFEVRMFDTRVDLPIPVVTAVAIRMDGKLGKLCYAAGSSMDPVQAMRAALCEIASYVPSFNRRVELGLDEARAMEADFGLVRELKHHALLHGLDSMAVHSEFLLGSSRARPISEVYADWEASRPQHDDLTDDLRWLVDVLADYGFEAYAVDQTTPEQKAMNLYTFATIVPGLVPIDFGWHKQRAFQMKRVRSVHREAGLRDYDLDVSQLNSVPHPFP